MSDAQSKIEMWVLAEIFDNDPTTSIFTSLDAALGHIASTQYGEEDEFEDFCAECRENDTGGRMEWGDDYIVLIKSEVIA